MRLHEAADLGWPCRRRGMITWIQPSVLTFVWIQADPRGCTRDLVESIRRDEKMDRFVPTPVDLRADDWEVLVWNGPHAGVYSTIADMP